MSNQPNIEKESAIKKDLQTIEEFKNNPENKRDALLFANQIKTFVSTNWFKASKMCTVFKLTEAEAEKKLMSLVVMEVCVTKHNPITRKNEYRIDINQKEQIKLLRDNIALLKEQLAKDEKNLTTLLEKSK